MLAIDMLQKCPSTSLHRIPALPFTEPGTDPNPLVELPLLTPCANAQSLRTTLHAVLGSQLRGYGLALDPVRQLATVTLHVHLGDVEQTMRCLMAALPTAQFGRIAKIAMDEVRRCH
ncbi:hypothetical protein PMI14_05110 [Acidovorax sp. CF316]|jgi:hypothetical protein|uniref:hypothetical protein n=1 Tax=Acidovorax sp. CF316 TaxID=1144317 RepID=UPI00026BEF02|nr:hypothetical protein [Acidovorax sp. CF316]EJE50305.1 hypothetical protein PMI14_05110 [Acidovorax sp. CF316]